MTSIFSWTLFLSKSDCFCTKTVATAVCSHKCAKNVRQAKWLNNAFIKQWEADTRPSNYSNSWFLVSFGDLPVVREKIIPFLMPTLQWIQTWVYAVLCCREGLGLSLNVLYKFTPSLRATEHKFPQLNVEGKMSCELLWLSSWRAFECFPNTLSSAIH